MNVILLENVRQLGEDQDQTIKLQAKYNPVECRVKKKNKYNPVECRAKKEKKTYLHDWFPASTTPAPFP